MADSSNEIHDDALRLGVGIRQARKQRGLTLADLAQLSGLSVSALSQIERGGRDPSLSALRRIATGLGVSLMSLVAAEGPSGYIVQPEDRKTITFANNDLIYQSLTPDAQGDLEMLLCTFPPRSKVSHHPLVHPGDECLFVLRGEVVIDIENVRTTIGAGASAYLPRGVGHGLGNESAESAEVLFAISPPIS